MKIKKLILTLINVISVLMIAVAVFALVTVLFTPAGEAPTVFGWQILRVTTGSMAPTYPTDTMVFVRKTDPADIEPGDVISFYSSDPGLDGALNTHRVVEVREEDGHYVYVTRGDANNVRDQYDADSRRLLGKVVGSSYLLGKLSRLISNPLIFIPVILVPLAVILIGNIVRTVSYARVLAKEEAEEEVRQALELIRERKQAENGTEVRERKQAENGTEVRERKQAEAEPEIRKKAPPDQDGAS